MNIEAGLLHAWLTKQDVTANLISRALFELNKVANDAGKSLYVFTETPAGASPLAGKLCQEQRRAGLLRLLK
ncbi:hypothetical protein SAMN04244572_04990 [Azotobacter beijerinckii]|uniref:Uncharacterized protein n=1 Tax=Azotobacter beijerinckii TaxID=170623 RepID=A0A1H7B2R1_9GAMM|nr:hypothetical protein [Azotobacter beijerinckii]SEJ72039.1 hypothetical protein SAMN04244572_04990 [Azotobacter beijerinckii]